MNPRTSIGIIAAATVALVGLFLTYAAAMEFLWRDRLRLGLVRFR